MDSKKRPGYLTQYAAHAGISKQAAAEQLKRVGVEYLVAFDFAEADRRRAAARHADRAPFSRPIYATPDDVPVGNALGEASIKDPAFAELQIKREHYRAELARLDFEERVQTLTQTEHVQVEAFRIGRMVRDSVLNVPSRLSGILAAESDQRKVHELLEHELRRALDALALDDGQTGGHAAA